MPKKTLILIGGIILAILLVIGGVFVFLSTTNTDTKLTIGQAVQKLNPFGDGGIVRVGKEVVNTISNSIVSNQDSRAEESSSEPTQQVLFKLSEERSSGIGFAEVLIPKTIEVRKKITIDDPTIATTSKPRKISVMATTTETIYSTTTRVRFVEQGSGHIYEYNQASSTTRKLTNTTLPKTQESYFLDNGNKVLLRYLDNTNKTIENYLATIPVSAVTDKLSGIFLPTNIQSLSISNNTTEFFYLAKTSAGSIGNIYNTKTNSERRVFSSQFSEWLPQWVGSNIFVTTKASYGTKGYVYVQSLTNSALSRLTGNKLGLTTLASPDGTRVLLGEGLTLSILTVSTGQIIPIQNVYTLPEKCVWRDTASLYCFGLYSPAAGNFPDIWYQGKQNTNDDLYSINSITGESYILETMRVLYTKEETFFDVLNPLLSKDKKSLVFINKLDMTPWYLDVSQLVIE